VKAGEEKVVTYAARGPSGWLAGSVQAIDA
jgi:hypothetical protein